MATSRKRKQSSAKKHAGKKAGARKAGAKRTPKMGSKMKQAAMDLASAASGAVRAIIPPLQKLAGETKPAQKKASGGKKRRKSGD